MTSVDLIERIGATPTEWKLAGVVFMYAVFFVTFYGVPYVDFLPPLGMGVTESEWFLPVLILFTPLFLLTGSWAGNILMSSQGGKYR